MKKKKLLSLALAVTMLFGSAAALPEGVFSESTSITASAEVSKATSGKCGENVSWSLKNGVLTISGSGKMTDYDLEDDSPFYYREDITSVIIKSGVTSIGDCIFYNCENLKSVTIPDSIKNIGRYAFLGTGLTNITIPDSVTSIETGAFQVCAGLKSATVSKNLTKIGRCVFQMCYNLESVNIPSGVTCIDNSAFMGCMKLEKIIIPKNVTHFGTHAFYMTKWLENQQNKNPLVIVNNIIVDGVKCVGKVTVPSGVKAIGDSAFIFNNKLTGITIPSSVTSIGYSAFQNCEKLQSITIPKNVTKIEAFAFSSTKWLYELQKKDPLVVVNGMLINGQTCEGKVTIPDNVWAICDYALAYGNNIKEVVIPRDVSEVGYSAFENCKNLSSVTISGGIERLSEYSFKGCTNLKDVSISNDVMKIGYSSFENCNSLKKVIIPNSINSVEDHAFGYEINDQTLNPEHKKQNNFNIFCYKGTAGEKYAKENGFAYKYLSTDYEFEQLADGSAKITKYNGKADSVTIPSTIGGKKVTSIGVGAFFENKEIKSVIIPNSVVSIDEQVFESCSNLAAISIPNTLKEFGGNAFYGTKWLENQQKKNPLVVVNGILIDGKKSSGNATIPGTVKSIAPNAFAYNDKIKSVSIPGTVESIGKCAFWYCSNLKSLTIPQGVKHIGYSAFEDCSALNGVTVLSKDVVIDDFALGFYVDYAICKAVTKKGFTITCYKGSTAEKYAKENKIKYTLIRNPEPKATRLAGANRYETASIISKKMNPKTSDTVIIATGITYQDALVAVPLASAHNAPLLLATEKHITAQTEAELKRLKAKNVIVVSTNGAIGSGAKAELKALGLKATYIEGRNVFETSTKVAKALQTQNKKAPDTIFFATDSAFADALSASPVAAIKGAPIIYLNNKSIDKATADYLKSVKGKIKNAYIIGGNGVISDAMMKNVAKALGLTSGKTVQRVAGANRYETCVAVNKKFKSMLTGTGICVAKGLDFPDALAGGVYAAATRQALFLADGKKLQDVQNTYLKGKNAGKITVFGGTGAVSDSLVKLIAKASV